jgi:[ribosomal protein S5]-alanine N-acetyltransferase
MVVLPQSLPAIETDRLRLRCAEERDAPAISGLLTEAISRRLASWPYPYTLPMAEDRITGVRVAAAQRRSLPLVIERLSDRVVMGWIAISRAPGQDSVALLTYWLGDAFQGHGYMSEAAPAAVRHAFALLDVATLRAAVQGDNDASLGIVRLLGMSSLGEGRIWCPARGREEACLWFELDRPAEMAKTTAGEQRAHP